MYFSEIKKLIQLFYNLTLADFRSLNIIFSKLSVKKFKSYWCLKRKPCGHFVELHLIGWTPRKKHSIVFM